MKHIIPLELIELEEENYHLTVTSRFEDGSQGIWVIDTGASKTVFSLALSDHYDLLPADEDKVVKSAGIGSDHLDTAPGNVHPFYLKDCLITDLKVALIDLSHINSLYYHATEKEICGLIGSDFLMAKNAVIDYPHLQMVLSVRKKKKPFGF
jgi:hypothetical protein